MKDKKIGIVTFHRALSYGATLQAYALQNFLADMGAENEIIDYKCQYMIDHYQKTFRKTGGNKIKGMLWSLMTSADMKKSKKTINEFVSKNLVMSKPYDSTNIAQAKDDYSLFICGSDQVWSPTCVGFDPVYFLTFADSEQKYSYAASIATSEIPEGVREEFKNRISDFQGYSVREESGAKIVSDLIGKQPIVSVDPTLLMNSEKWDKLVPARKISEPYILLFTVLKPVELISFAKKLGKEKGMKVIYLNNQQPKKTDGVEYIDPVTSDEFVSLIKNAEYVCTNSFHGTAFSLIYHKNFVVETQTAAKKNIRSEELMNKLGLSNRILAPNSDTDINANSDWKKVDEILESERQKSAEYLKSFCK